MGSWGRALGGGAVGIVSVVAWLVACASTADPIAGVAAEGDGGPGSLTADGSSRTDTSDRGDDDDVTDAGSGEDADASSHVDRDSGPTGPKDAGACNGVVRYSIPAGSYAWGHRCSGFVLYNPTPPTQTDCQYVGETVTNKCLKWGPGTVYFKQSSAAGQDCDIEIFPRLDGGDTHSCPL